MEVLGRSYGISSIMVYRGPQFVQLIKGYRYRKSLGEKSSFKQSSQMDMSGEMSVDCSLFFRLEAMPNDVSPLPGTSHAETSVMWARGGGCAVKSLTKESMASVSPSI